MKLLLACILAVAAVQAQYCAGNAQPAGPSRTEDGNLGAVTLRGDGSSIQDDSDCPGQTNVVDKTTMKADVKPGGSYTLRATATTCNMVLPRMAAAWIDYNDNKVWEENEKLGEFRAEGSARNQEVSFPFTPPCDAATGATVRMRVIVVESGQPGLLACEAFNWGGAKDFSIQILTSPGAACGGGGLSGGSIFLILMTVGVFLWIAGGCLYLRKYKGTTGMTESCFGYNALANFCALVREGCLFSREKAKKVMNRQAGDGLGANFNDEI